LDEAISLRELGEKIGVTPINLIKELMGNGIMATINQQLDFDTAAIVVSAFGWEAKQKEVIVESAIPDEVAVDATGKPTTSGKVTTLRQRLLAKETTENVDGLQTRAPVVTIMGHVDHGKTSLLDAIRKANVADGEAGGITQHIGAYQVDHDGRKVTFIDTPGHEAFTAMRARGAQVTDVAVLVVAADDGVMPQTKEAIAHAKAAQVPIVVALNKIDKNNANPDRVKQELIEAGLVSDEYGGDTMIVPVSARQKKGIDDLLEGILLTAETLDSVKANPNRPAVGTIIEAELDKQKGSLATVLVQNGTLELGDAFVIGTVYGRVRAMYDFRGNRIKKAGPSVPVSITGMSEVPAAGEVLEVVSDDRAAKALAAQNLAKAGRNGGAVRATSLDQYFAQAKASQAKKLALIVKTANQGSLPPLVEQLEKLNTEDVTKENVRLNIIMQGTGQITESDVELAVASGAVILGFEVAVDNAARKKAEANKVDVRLYDVIYKLIEEIELALKGMLPKKIITRVLGAAEVKQIFKIPKVGTVAGSVVRSGTASRNNTARVLRAGQQLFSGTVGSLKRLTDDVKEVRTGLECGISLEGFTDFKAGDVIEFVVEEEES
jgi:translation initiation factor IF-2